MWRRTLRSWIALAGLLVVTCLALALPAAGQAPASLPPAVARGQNAVPLPAHARAWVDDGAASTVTQVEAESATLPWRLRTPGQVDRIDGKALWLQFDVVSGGDGAQWFLEVASSGIDRVQMFYRDPAGAWVTQEAGDSQPMTLWPVPGRYPTLVLSREPRTRYYMRIEQSRLDFSAPITLYPAQYLLAKRDTEQILLGSFFGIALLVAVAALASGIAYRDRAFRVFAFYILAVGAGQLARAGVGAQHLWPDWPWWNEFAICAWPGLPVAAALWFVRVLTEPARLSPALDWGVWGLTAAVLAGVALDAALRTRLSMNLVLAFSGLSMAAILAMVVWGWLDGRDPDLRLVALGFVPVVLLALIPMARAFNLIPVSAASRFAVFFGTALQMPLLYYALQVRSLRRRESELRASALSRADALTGLPHRSALLERLETTLARARNHKQPFALLGVRLANLEAIADEFGRETGDKALVVAGSHLRRAITDVDMAARVGERDFVLLLESPSDSPTAVSRAQQVIASGLRRSDPLPGTVMLKFHVTIAMLPHEELGGVAALQWVVDALDHFSPDAKKHIRPLNF
jgi:diguanylate cyclase (GGDEF)-like protein